MTANSQLLTTTLKNKSKLSKQLEQEQNYRNGDHMEGYQQVSGRGREGEKVGGLCPQVPPPRLPQMRISLPRHDLLGEERWLISQRRRTKSLFLSGLLLGSNCTGIQAKLINHCQAVRIKQR